MEEIRLAIIEDDPTINKSLCMAIDMQVQMHTCFSAFSVEEALERIDDGETPQIILLDIGLPGMTGLEAIPVLKEKLPEVDIIMLTTYDESEKIFQALCSGACSYLSKKVSLQTIIDAIFTVSRGGSFMSPSIARKIANHFVPKRSALDGKLSDRQMDIVKSMADGLSYQQIADKNYISINTVRTHIKNIYELLQINSKGQLLKLYNQS